MKQIPSIFVDDDEHKELLKVKATKDWTWKDMLLYHIKNKKKG